MAANHRKILFPHQPGKNVNLTFFVPCLQTYPPPPPLQRNLSVLVSTSLCIMGSVLLFLFLAVFLYLYITQSRRSTAAAAVPLGGINRREDDNEAGDRDISNDHHVWRITTVGLQRSAIDSITVVGFKKGEGIVDGTDCSVCLNEFEENESLRLLPKCSHAFHVNCIDTWLLSHKNCPLCRSPVFPTEPRHKKTETNHQSESRSSNDDLNHGEEESSGSRNANVLLRAQSDLATHCSSRSLETVRRSFSIEGSLSVKAGDSDEIATGSRRHFCSSFSANFFSSSSRRSRNQDPVLPNRIPSVSG